jgi:hypothetical protein
MSGFKWLCHLRCQQRLSKRWSALQSTAVSSEVCAPLATLLSDAAGEMWRNKRPLLRAVHSNELPNLFVFLLAPGAFDQVRVEHLRPGIGKRSVCHLAIVGVGSAQPTHDSAAYLLPAMQALDVSLVGQALRDLLPVAPAVLLHHRAQLVVLRTRHSRRHSDAAHRQ